MNINDLKTKVDLHHAISDKNNPEQVVIQLSEPRVAMTSCVDVSVICAGFDWDHGKIFIVPSEPLVRRNGLFNAEREFIAQAIAAEYKYICRFPNGDILISKTIPTRTTRSWKYDKKASERTSLYRNHFKKLTFENGGVMSLSSFLHKY